MIFGYTIVAILLLVYSDAESKGLWKLHGDSTFFEGNIDSVQGALEDIQVAGSVLNLLEGRLKTLVEKSDEVFASERKIESGIDTQHVHNYWKEGNAEKPCPSHSCVAGEFCNFDHDTSGHCEVCSDIHDDETCTDLGLKDKKGETDCFEKCKVPCQWGSYKNGDCDQPCGGGTRKNTRTKIVVEKHGGSCLGDASETEDCPPNPCPVDCKWNSYTTNGCSKTSGKCIKEKTRTKAIVEDHGGKCIGLSSMTEDCSANSCPVTVSCGSTLTTNYGCPNSGEIRLTGISENNCAAACFSKTGSGTVSGSPGCCEWQVDWQRCMWNPNEVRSSGRNDKRKAMDCSITG